MAKPGFQQYVVRFEAGQPIFHEGDPGTTMFIVQSGTVKLYRNGDETERLLGVMRKGDFFGEASILEGLARTCSAAAEQDCEVIEIDSTTFERMVRGNMEIAVRLMRKLGNRLREAERRIAELASGTGAAPRVPVTARSAEPSAGRQGEGVRLELDPQAGGRSYPVCEPECIIGRFDPVSELRPDIDLTDMDLKRSVSRRHARIFHNQEGWFLVEEGGVLNGTSVNGTELVSGEPHPLRDGDSIALGTVRVTFRT